MTDLARKIDSMRQFGYVLLTPKEAKRVAIELRRVEWLKKQVVKSQIDTDGELIAAYQRGYVKGREAATGF